MPPRKAADRRINRSTKDIGVVSALPVVAQSRFPAPDPAWVPEVAEAWHEFASSPLADPKLLKSTDLPALRRLFSYRDRLVRAEVAFADEPTCAGSMGQEVLSPWAQEIHRLEGAINKLEDRFGMSPLSRFRLGLRFEEGVGLAVRNAQLLERYKAGGPESLVRRRKQAERLAAKDKP